ncbi:MAG: acyl carrier protein [Candidatus Komeilibacteria bacterium]
MEREVAVLTDDQILGTIKGILEKQFNIDPDKVTLQVNLIKDLPLDSLDVVEFAAEVEEVFAIELHPDDQDQLELENPTIRETVNLVKKYTN